MYTIHTHASMCIYVCTCALCSDGCRHVHIWIHTCIFTCVNTVKVVVYKCVHMHCIYLYAPTMCLCIYPYKLCIYQDIVYVCIDACISASVCVLVCVFGCIHPCADILNAEAQNQWKTQAFQTGLSGILSSHQPAGAQSFLPFHEQPSTDPCHQISH